MRLLVHNDRYAHVALTKELLHIVMAWLDRGSSETIIASAFVEHG